MSDLLDDLERLAALLEKDLITREQFEEQRDALMSRGEAATAPPQEDMPPPIEEPLAPAPPMRMRLRRSKRHPHPPPPLHQSQQLRLFLPQNPAEACSLV